MWSQHKLLIVSGIVVARPRLQGSTHHSELRASHTLGKADRPNSMIISHGMLPVPSKSPQHYATSAIAINTVSLMGCYLCPTTRINTEPMPMMPERALPSSRGSKTSPP
jgi:hypothetical protein